MARINFRAGWRGWSCRTLRWATLSLAVFSCAGCGQTADAKRAPVTLKIGIALPPPGGMPSTGAGGFVNSYLLSDTLVGIGWNGRPVRRLAPLPEAIDEGLGVRFTLPPGLKLHDGTPLTADLATKILQRAISENQSSTVSYPSIVAAAPESELTFSVRLSRPESFLLTDLGNVNIQHPDKENIGAGPFKLAEVADGGATMRLTANEHYYRGRPQIDALEVRNYRDQRAAWSALMRGEISGVHELSPGGVEFVEGAKAIRIFPSLRPYYSALFFNQRHPVLRRPSVRQALSQAVDRSRIIDLALHGRGTVANGPIWPFHWAYSTAQRTYAFNPEAATLRLDMSGLPVLRDPSGMPKRFGFKCLILAGDPRFERMALVLQRQLFEVGVEVQIEPVPIRELPQRIYKGDYDSFLFEWTSGRSLGLTYATWHSAMRGPFSFNSGYNAADAILDRLRETTTDADTRAAVGDLQRVFYEDPPGIFIAWPEVTRAISTAFEVPDEPGRDVMGSLWQWRPSAPPPGPGR